MSKVVKFLNYKIALIICALLLVVGLIPALNVKADAASITPPSASSVVKLRGDAANLYNLEWTDDGILWSTISPGTCGVWVPLTGKYEATPDKPFVFKYSNVVFSNDYSTIVGNNPCVYLQMTDSNGRMVNLSIYGNDQNRPSQGAMSTAIFFNQGVPNEDFPTSIIFNTGYLDGDCREGEEIEIRFDNENYFTGKQNGKYSTFDDASRAVKKALDAVNFAADGMVEVHVLALRDTAVWNSTVNQEMYITEIDGQSLKTEADGKIIDTVAPLIDLTDVEENIAVSNNSLTLNVAAYDVLDSSVDMTMTVKQGETTIKDKVSDFRFDRSTPGVYEVIFEATDDSENKSSKSITIAVKDNFTFPEINFNEEYSANINSDEDIKIINATASDGNETVSLTVKVITPSGKEETVNLNENYTPEEVGVYKIIYEAADQASPTPNVTTKEFEVLIVDVQKPFMTITDVPTSCKVNDTVTLPEPTASDNSGTVKIKITVKDPDGETVDLRNNQFVANKKGTYTVVYEARDNMGNKTLSGNYEIVAGKGGSAGSGCGSMISTSVMGGFVLSLVATAFVCKKKK